METVLKRIINYINHTTNPEEIMLFGSMASGTNDAFSDIDLLVISENTYQRHKIIQEIKAFVAQLGYNSDILMLKKEELKKEIENPKSLLHNALKIHQKVYKKQP